MEGLLEVDHSGRVVEVTCGGPHTNSTSSSSFVAAPKGGQDKGRVWMTEAAGSAGWRWPEQEEFTGLGVHMRSPGSLEPESTPEHA